MSVRVEVQHSESGRDEWHKQLENAIKTASYTMADRLRAQLAWNAGTSGPRTGRHYPQYPHPSSSKGQYPQEQFGNLRGSVDDRPEGSPGLIFTRGVGFYGENMRKLEELELKQWAGQRKPLTMLVEDPETREEMAEAIRTNDSV